jgi:SSS family solute:Na+ symporter
VAQGYFHALDWLVVGAYFGLVWLISHRLQGRQTGTHEYFLGSRSLPWPAVAASIVSTAISGVTFVGVPALVFAQGGDYRYLQFALAGVISKWVIGQFIMPRLYEREYASPYDYIRDRLGPVFGRVSALLFFIGAVLGQGVRVYAVALVLELLTGLGSGWCIALSIGAAVVSTWLGGVRAVVWTDVLQFVMLVAGGAVAILYVTHVYPGGFGALLEAGAEAGKTRVFDLSLDPRLQFTLWAGVFAMPFQNLAAYGTDQLNTQRMLCCRSVREARLALYWSNAGELVVVLFLTVGLALWGFYGFHPIDPAFAPLVAEKGDRIFPAFILSELPVGLRGFMVAALFAAAMASPVLSALAETTLTMFHDGHRDGTLSPARALWFSRVAVVVWGVILGGFAFSLAGRGEQLVPLAFQMTTYTYGPMLGLFVLALFVPRERIHSLALGVAVSMFGVMLVGNAAQLGLAPAGGWVAFPWLFPLGGSLCVAFAMLPLRRSR